MPLASYDALFGGKAGSAAKVKRSLVKQHGEPKATEIFMAMVNDRRKRGGLKKRLRSARKD